MQTIKPIILGCSGPTLAQEERDFFAQLNPFGFILFQRNCENPDQVRLLTQALRATVGRPDAPIFIDQEGGRVARLKPPLWPSFPSQRRLGVLYEQDQALGRMAIHLHALLIARMLRDVGINGNCAPVLDLMIDGASSAIGDRALAFIPDVVAAGAKVIIDTYLQNGIFPVIKHIPGHGRVRVDPHAELPYVDCDLATLRRSDFIPFSKLSDAPIAMNCHVVFRDIDPKNPISFSHKAHEEIIRGEIGFDGLLFSDDLAMGAVAGDLKTVASRALEAGADIALYCTGLLPEMRIVCADLPDMSRAAQARWDRAQDMCTETESVSTADVMQARLDQLLSLEL
ncbi:MAG: beta-N-acetylhexosaminidase [Alphaproteobacteria bacterium]|nr:beta-N-acetylhexosaminidase [Alphaproteobacteria bacterium]